MNTPHDTDLCSGCGHVYWRHNAVLLAGKPATTCAVPSCRCLGPDTWTLPVYVEPKPA